MIATRALSRRGFLTAIGAGASAVTIGACNIPPPGVDPPILPPPVLPDDLLLRLLNRATIGPTAAEVNAAVEMGYDAWLEQQLNPDSIDDADAQNRVGRLGTLTAAPDVLFIFPEDLVRNELIAATFTRAVHSRRQLHERMVEFWTDHFNIFHYKDATPWLKTIDDRDVIRRHALGNFRELLQASGKSPAMLVYLDNVQNVAGGPNENYPRELLELHTLGVAGGYTQTDVENVARALTGWSVRPNFPGRGTFIFNAGAHDNGAKQIMGLSLPAGGGISDGEQLLDYLARHPSTAKFIARKLVRHFIAPSAPADLVQTVAAAFSSSDGDIRTTLRALFSRESLARAEPTFKRPFHLLADVTRRSGSEVRVESGLELIIAAMGHLPFAWPAPNGYPDAAAYWSPGMLHRWNYAMYMASNSIRTTPVNPREIALANNATTTEQVLALWSQMFFGNAMPADERDAIAAYVNADPGDEVRRYLESFALAISSPSFQWC